MNKETHPLKPWRILALKLVLNNTPAASDHEARSGLWGWEQTARATAQNPDDYECIRKMSPAGQCSFSCLFSWPDCHLCRMDVTASFSVHTSLASLSLSTPAALSCHSPFLFPSTRSFRGTPSTVSIFSFNGSLPRAPSLTPTLSGFHWIYSCVLGSWDSEACVASPKLKNVAACWGHEHGVRAAEAVTWLRVRPLQLFDADGRWRERGKLYASWKNRISNLLFSNTKHKLYCELPKQFPQWILRLSLATTKSMNKSKPGCLSF